MLFLSERDEIMIGEVVFTSYDKVNELNLERFDYKLQIVRYTNNGLKEGFLHFPTFSPSEKLFNKTMRGWKRLKFTKSEKEFMANGKTGTWFDLYEAHFFQEKSFDKSFKEAIQAVITEVNQGKRFLMICYCENLERCHRKLVADMLQEAGVPVSHF